MRMVLSNGRNHDGTLIIAGDVDDKLSSTLMRLHFAGDDIAVFEVGVR